METERTRHHEPSVELEFQKSSYQGLSLLLSQDRQTLKSDATISSELTQTYQGSFEKHGSLTISLLKQTENDV
jgi:hypothetical protein